jgi:hypothetical protein
MIAEHPLLVCVCAASGATASSAAKNSFVMTDQTFALM